MLCFIKKINWFWLKWIDCIFLQNVNFFEHSHLKGVVDSSHDTKGSVESDIDSNNDEEEKENDDFKAENVKECDDREEEKENEFEINK